MTSTYLIGMCGKARSGKSTIAKFLCEESGFREVSLATPLKNGLIDMFGFTNDQVHGDKKEEIDPYWNVTPREVMQVVGTELMRNSLPEFIPTMNNVWIRIAQRKIKEYMSQGYSVVVSDVRFSDEVMMIRELNGSVWQVVRDPVHANQTMVHDHVSEHLSTIPDVVYVNNQSIKELHKKVRLELQQIKGMA